MIHLCANFLISFFVLQYKHFFLYHNVCHLEGADDPSHAFDLFDSSHQCSVCHLHICIHPPLRPLFVLLESSSLISIDFRLNLFITFHCCWHLKLHWEFSLANFLKSKCRTLRASFNSICTDNKIQQQQWKTFSFTRSHKFHITLLFFIFIFFLLSFRSPANAHVVLSVAATRIEAFWKWEMSRKSWIFCAITQLNNLLANFCSLAWKMKMLMLARVVCLVSVWMWARIKQRESVNVFFQNSKVCTMHCSHATSIATGFVELFSASALFILLFVVIVVIESNEKWKLIVEWWTV